MARNGFQFDPAAAVAHLRGADPVLGALIDRTGPFNLELKPQPSLFAALMRSIVYQQLHGKAAATILGRVRERLAVHGGDTPEALARLGDTELRAAGLSAGKTRAVRDLAAKCQAGVVPTLAAARKLPDDVLVERLTEVHGIGPWTVHMLLIFTLGRPDVLPTGDFAIRLGYGRLYGCRREPTPATMIRRTAPWRPYRSVASWYLWRSLD